MKIVHVALAFLLGVCIFQLNPMIPDWSMLIMLAVITVYYASHRLWLLCVILFAYLWSAAYAHWILYPVLDESYINQPVEVNACVRELRTVSPDYIRFLATIHTKDRGLPPLPNKALLSWYAPTSNPAVGQCLRITVKLKPPHGVASDGAYDRETWYYLQSIGASGVLQARHGVEYVTIDSKTKFHFFIAIKNSLHERIYHWLKGSEYWPLIYSLATGNRAHLQNQHWQILQFTGTSHLLAISGLHIGAIALVWYWLALRVIKCSVTLCQRFPAQRLAALFAVLGASIYALLSGFAVPAQRALIMLVAFTAVLWMRQRINPAQPLAIACVIVLLLDPRQVLTAGFWFSFVAVAVILLSVHFSNINCRIYWFIKLQLILSCSAFAITLYYFGNASVLMPVANLVAVPVISFFVLPLILLAILLIVVFAHEGEWLLWLLDSIMHYLWHWLEWLAELDWAIIQWRPALAAVLFFHLAILLMFMLAGWRDRWLALLFAAMLFVPARHSLSHGQFRVSVLDVGQGLAVVVETAAHVLVYDTGPRYNSGFNTGEAVVIPYLRAKNLHSIDRLVVSHNDLDHRGGVESLLAEYAVDEIHVSQQVADVSVSQMRCERGYRWHWEGVEFEYLHPISNKQYSRNNGSCVLKISSANGSLLISGDIERSAERELILANAPKLQSNVLIVPHHGSLTSSSKRFLSTVAPQLAINSAGYLNQYGFPHPFIQRRYTRQRIALLNTAELGTIEVLFSKPNQQPVISAYREQHDRYWHWTGLRQYH